MSYCPIRQPPQLSAIVAQGKGPRRREAREEVPSRRRRYRKSRFEGSPRYNCAD